MIAGAIAIRYEANETLSLLLNVLMRILYLLSESI